MHGRLPDLGLAPLAWLFVRSSPEAIGLEVDGGDVPPRTAARGPIDATLGDALGSPAFWVCRAGQLDVRAHRVGHRSVQRVDPGGTRVCARGLSPRSGSDSHHGARRQLRRGCVRRPRLAPAGARWRRSCCSPAAWRRSRAWSRVGHVMAQAVVMGLAGGFVMVVFFSFWGQAYGRTHLGRIQGAAQAMTVLASAVGPLFLALWVRGHRVLCVRLLCARGGRGDAGGGRRAGADGRSRDPIRASGSRQCGLMTFRVLVLPRARVLLAHERAVVAGVATAVAVLAGALLVGDSVRGSLRELVESATRRAPIASSSPLVSSANSLRRCDLARFTPLRSSCRGSSRGRTADAVSAEPGSTAWTTVSGGFTVCPASPVRANATRSSAPLLPASLARHAGEAILVRVQRPSAIPLESVHGRKDDLGRTLRLIVRSVLAPDALGEFSLEAAAGRRASRVRAAVAPAKDLEIAGRVNALLGLAVRDRRWRARSCATQASLDDSDSASEPLDARGAIVLESDAGLLDDCQAAAAIEALKETPG